MIIGLDIKKYGDTRNMSKEKFFVFKRPKENGIRKLMTYIDKDKNGDERIWLDIAPNRKSTISSLLANVRKRTALTMVKKVHRFTNGTEKEMTTLFKEADMLSPEVEKAIQSHIRLPSMCKEWTSN